MCIRDSLKGRPFAPQTPEEWDAATRHWRTLKSDSDASFDHTVVLNASDLIPQVTWGTSPEMLSLIHI